MTLSPGYRDGALVTTTLRVATWNVWWRFGGNWEARQPGLIRVLEEMDADLIALQEVWEDGSACQADLLAEALGYERAWTGASRIDGIHFGNAILSRWPLTATSSRMLPSMPSDDGGRNCRVLHARAAGPRGEVDLYTAHLSYRPEESHVRQQQVRAICRWVHEQGTAGYPPVVAGDFNATPESDEVRMMTGKTAVPVDGLVFYDAWESSNQPGPGFTWSHENVHTAMALEPNRRLDYVFVGKPLANGAGHAVSAKLVGTEPVDGLFPSDHFGVVADLRY